MTPVEIAAVWFLVSVLVALVLGVLIGRASRRDRIDRMYVHDDVIERYRRQARDLDELDQLDREGRP